LELTAAKSFARNLEPQPTQVGQVLLLKLSWELSAARFLVLVLQAGLAFREFLGWNLVRSTDATPSDFLPRLFGSQFVHRSITRHQAEYRYDEGLYLRSTAILKTFAGAQLWFHHATHRKDTDKLPVLVESCRTSNVLNAIFRAPTKSACNSLPQHSQRNISPLFGRLAFEVCPHFGQL